MIFLHQTTLVVFTLVLVRGRVYGLFVDQIYRVDTSDLYHIILCLVIMNHLWKLRTAYLTQEPKILWRMTAAYMIQDHIMYNIIVALHLSAVRMTKSRIDCRFLKAMPSFLEILGAGGFVSR